MALAMVTVLAVGCAANPPSGDEKLPPQEDDVLAEARAAAESGEYAFALDLLLGELDERDDAGLARQAAQIAIAIEDWEAAARAADRWRELEPASSQAVQVALLAALRRGDTARAVDLVVDGLVASDEDPEESWLRATEVLARGGDPVRSEQVLDSALERAEAPSPGFGDYLRSRLAARTGQREKAYRLAEAALARQPGFDRAMWAANLAQALGRPERALAHFRTAAERVPDDRAAVIGQVQILRELERPEEALELLDGMAADPELLYTRGILEQELGRMADAGVTWQRLVSVNAPEAEERKAWLAGLLAELLDMPERAVHWYARAQGRFASRADLRRAGVLAGMGETAAARRVLAELRMEADPEIKERAWLLESRILVDQGDGERAVEMLSDALRQLPGSEDLLYARAMAAVEVERIPLAEQDLRAIIQNDPENAIALNALGYTLSDRTDRQREALRLIETALELDPDNPAILDSMGWVLFRLGRADEALPYLERAAAADPHPEIVSHLIEVLSALARTEEARDWVERVRDEFTGEPVFDDTLERTGLE
ncbi:MAG: tetratricopeptide repeat protein [Candidatus Wenzhouxiangella sp. M2_3B_020]